MTARDVIAQALALSEAATDGPWEGWAGRDPNGAWRNGISPASDPEVDICITPRTPQGVENAEFIAAARTLLPALAKALRDVLDEMERPVHLDDTDDGCVPVRRLHAITAALSGVRGPAQHG